MATDKTYTEAELRKAIAQQAAQKRTRLILKTLADEGFNIHDDYVIRDQIHAMMAVVKEHDRSLYDELQAGKAARQEQAARRTARRKARQENNPDEYRPKN